ncbi:MAG: 23S rRNA (uracil(1939)-C(5))-methyltransferase RlmD [Erysipelotrichaceae bacterium]|nr:23S rRNA (uracil(1939)-C(5))-methyltransferase RlmD [Erysipelotrichaceae bacterium]
MTRTLKPCPVREVCGGCRLQHLTYEKQLEFKLEKARKQIGSFGDVEEIIGMKDPYFYRNKVQISFGYDYNGRVLAGNYVTSTHTIVPVKQCQLADKKANDIFNTMIALQKSFKLSVFDEHSMQGFLRHVLVRTSADGEEVMVVIVAGSPVFPKKNGFINALLEKHPYITTIVLNVNNRRTSMILGDRNTVLYGKGYIEDDLLGYTFRISPSSFYQVNHVQTEKLYSLVSEFAQLKEDDILFDAYCGTGTIGITLANQCKEVIGVEINKNAVRDAGKNARINNIKNITFYCDDAGKFMVRMAQEKQKVNVVIMDPPRAGSDEKFLSSLVRLNPDRVVYVSCNPVTQKRDLKYLTSHGYKVNRMKAVDMFPFTEHVETVVLLCRKGPAMLIDEKSKYKSWSNLKKQMNDLLCDPLKKSISYFYTNYHEVHNAYGRATINYNKKELVAFSWIEMYEQDQDINRLWQEGEKKSYSEMLREKWMPECTLCDANFIDSVTVFLKTDIAASLQSDNYLLRVFAYMDRRVGKRTLVKIRDEVEKLPEWVKQFYQIRCEAEGLCFQQNRTIDETVCCLYHQKKDFISVPYEPKDASYLKQR